MWEYGTGANVQRCAVGVLTNIQVRLSKVGNGETVGCTLDHDNVIDHDRTHDEAMTGDDDEPLFCPLRTTW